MVTTTADDSLSVAEPRRGLGWLLIPPLIIALTVEIARRSGGGLHSVSLFEGFAGAMAIVAAGYVLLQLPTVYMFSTGLVLSIFSGSWQYIGLPGIPDRALLLGSILLLLVREREQLARFRPNAAHALLLATVVYAAASAAADGTLGQRLGTFALLDQLGAIPFVLFFAVPLIVRTAEDRRVLLYVMVLLGLYLGFEALMEALSINKLVFPRFIINPSIGTFDGRVRGPFLSSVTEGFALFGCATACAVTLTTKPHPWMRAVAFVTMPLCLLGCFFTLERGIWIATVVSAIAVGVLTSELRRRVLPMLLIAAALLLGSLAFVPGLQQRAAKRSQTTLSVWDRENQDSAALRMIRARPLFGFGWASFPTASLAYFRQSPNYPMTGYGIELHDLYLSNAVELGLVGFALWLFAQLFAYGKALASRAPPEMRAWKIALVALIVFAAVAELFNPLEQTFSQLFIWTWAGVIMGAAWYYEVPAAAAAGVVRRRRMAATAPPGLTAREPRRPIFRVPTVDLGRSYAPWKRVRIPPRRLALAVAGIGAGAALGIGIAELTNSSAPSSNQPVTDGLVQVVLPSGWHQVSAAHASSLGLTDVFVLQRRQPTKVTLTIGTNVESGGALLPTAFLVGSRTPGADIVNAGSLVFYRYENLPALGRHATAYVLPSNYGAIIGVCRGGGPRTAVTAACQQVLQTVSLTAGAALPPGPDTAYARTLDQVITRLNGARTSDDAQLAQAATTAGQARAAGLLAAAHGRAAAALTGLSPGIGGPANATLVGALRTTAQAYSALSKAAAAQNATGYHSAARAVQQANSALTAALAQLSRLGYLVG